jgi:hypothetical protein
LHAPDCRVEAAISSGTLPQLATQLRQELAALAAKDYSSNALLQTKKQSLIIDLMHSCNVVEGLLAPEASGSGAAGFVERPTSPKDWAWSRQLRYYANVVRHKVPSCRCTPCWLRGTNHTTNCMWSIRLLYVVCTGMLA